jgi:hypothetical protein
MSDGNVYAAAYEGMAMGAFEVAKKMGLMYNGKRPCVNCVDRCMDCDNCKTKEEI